MVTAVNIKTDNLHIDKDSLELVLNSIIEDYTDFDIQLMKKYVQTKDLDNSKFINI